MIRACCCHHVYCNAACRDPHDEVCCVNMIPCDRFLQPTVSTGTVSSFLFSVSWHMTRLSLDCSGWMVITLLPTSTIIVVMSHAFLPIIASQEFALLMTSPPATHCKTYRAVPPAGSSSKEKTHAPIVHRDVSSTYHQSTATQQDSHTVAAASYCQSYEYHLHTFLHPLPCCACFLEHAPTCKGTQHCSKVCAGQHSMVLCCSLQAHDSLCHIVDETQVPWMVTC